MVVYGLIVGTMAITDVLASIEALPTRFSGPPDSSDGRYRIQVANISRDVVIAGKRCRVQEPLGVADVEISMDPLTWHEIQSGDLSGIEAFGQRRLSIRGSIEQSLHFEPSFQRPEGKGMRYTIERVEVRGGRVSALFAGHRSAPPLLLIHGLGATKASWLTVVPQLARDFRVIAMDLPGFGASDKPRGGYDAPWFADRVTRFIDALGYDSVYVAGNSMGGRIAMELGMDHPDRVGGIACLCPAAAFTRRPALALVRALRPELGIVASRLPRSRILPQMRGLFADPRCVEPEWYEAAVDDFLHVWRSPRARMAFFASLRNIYLDEPEGERGFWTRLGGMSVPSLYIYGRHDALISHRFARKVQRTLPGAEVVVWSDCGHVPQIEFPDRSARVLEQFFTRHISKRVSA